MAKDWTEMSREERLQAMSLLLALEEPSEDLDDKLKWLFRSAAKARKFSPTRNLGHAFDLIPKSWGWEMGEPAAIKKTRLVEGDRKKEDLEENPNCSPWAAIWPPGQPRLRIELNCHAPTKEMAICRTVCRAALRNKL
jgi:hypothetical protein